MSEQTQQPSNPHPTSDNQLWRFRWFLIYLYAIALILSIVAAVIIAIVTRNVLPGIIPTSLLFAMKPIVRWAFSNQEPLGQ